MITSMIPLAVAPYEVLKKHGTVAVEMETAALYTIAARYGAKALTVATISDCLITHEQLSSDARQESLGRNGDAGFGHFGLSQPLALSA